MKKVVFSFLTVAFVTLFVSCKETPKDPQTDVSVNDLAIADSNSESVTTDHLYVTAQSGLSLRAFNNLNSQKLAVIPYGTKIKVITPEEQPTMTVGGIQGGMHEVEFNHKKGFAFNGYLSKFFPPEQDISVKGYAEELQQLFPKVTYTEAVGGTASKPSTSEAITIPTTQWHEAFFIAQRLFDFPKEFDFPNPKGKDEHVIKDKMPKKDVWVSELQISRKENALQKIVYAYKAENLSSTVTITQEGEQMKIDRTEIIE
jgi:hypothetical protein